MAEEKDTVILEFQIEAGDAISEQEKLKHLLIDLKTQQQALQKAYKEGNITQKEFAQESVRVENSQKKLGAAYSDIQKKITGLKTPMADLTKSNEKLAAAFENLGANVNVGGVSITNVSSKLAAFATPAGIAVGLVGALGAAYASSANGAKDLEFAQNQLGFALQDVNNRLGALVGSDKDGEGFLSKLVGFGLKFSGVGLFDKIFGSNVIENSKAAALGVEKLQDAEREMIKLRATSSDRLQDNADKLTKINELSTTALEKQKLFAEINANLAKNRDEQSANLKEQIQILKDQLPFVKDQEGLQSQINSKELELSQTLKGINRLQESNARAASNAADAAQKELDARNKLLGNLSGKTKGFAVTGSEGQDEEVAQMQAQVDAVTEGEKKKTDAEQEHLDAYKSIVGEKEEIQVNELTKEQWLADNKKDINQLYYSQVNDLMTASAKVAAQVFGKQSLAYKAIASSQALVQSFLGAQEAFTSLASIPYVGPILGGIAAAAALASGLANVAAINNVKFAEGGYTGHGSKYQPAGIVHAGEVVWNQQDVAAAGGPSRANAMRPTYRGYADGGVVTAAQTAKFDQQTMMHDILKRIPAPVLDLRELAIEQSRINIKQLATEI